MKPDLTHQHIARRLLAEAELSERERRFCKGMARMRYMSESQEEWLGRLAKRLEKPAND